MNKQYHLIGIGAALIDTEIVINEEQLSQLGFTKGMMTLVDVLAQQRILSTLNVSRKNLYQVSGGSAANSIFVASHLGLTTGFMCKVSDDHNGRLFIDDMKQAGVSIYDQGVCPEGSTGECIVLITQEGARTMCTHLGVSATLGVNNMNVNAVVDADILYLESYVVTSPSAKAAVMQMVECARAQQTKVAISLSDPGIVEHFKADIATMVYGSVDLLFCNMDEGKQWTGKQTVNDVLEALRVFAKQVLVTDGANGAYVCESQRISHIKTKQVEVVDTNGAGDMFAGAFIAACAQGLATDTAAQFACNMATKVVSQFGPRLSADELRKELESLKRLVH